MTNGARRSVYSSMYINASCPTLDAHLEARLRELLFAVAGAFAEAQHQRHGRVEVLPEPVGHCPAAE